MAKSVKRAFPCCGREPEVGEYILGNMMGPCCVGCWLADDLERQEGKGNPQSDAIRGVPLIVPLDRLRKMQAHPDTEDGVIDWDPSPEAN